MYSDIARKIRKKKIETGGARSATYTRKDIEKIIPHREPFLLIDSIRNVDLAKNTICGERYIDTTDPVFAGHFPEFAVYPGVLLVEIMAQTGLCLAHFIKNNTVEIRPEHDKLSGFFTRIHNASFIKPVLPGDTVTIMAEVLEYDELLGVVASQIIKNEEIHATAILEVYFNE